MSDEPSFEESMFSDAVFAHVFKMKMMQWFADIMKDGDPPPGKDLSGSWDGTALAAPPCANVSSLDRASCHKPGTRRCSKVTSSIKFDLES